ncbi:hypothetical protein WB66_06675 [bacteria symbiont BFo1 of Frankliniella occidentalis]|nr:hypothetical protein AI28_05990 [bacteria symbiont BFo1 of Frankliniella occidentalis]KYP85535.1 hypothetical protein WB66_06675 [bacteria symbiont BFo1 of Frankliniella occidentalis]KYP90830.1 hypothetical protein WB91_06995 [bacteria symbiont BFo1 of Frankliniella occidentalis]
MPAKIIAGRNPCYAETWLCEVDTILCQFEFSRANEKCKEGKKPALHRHKFGQGKGKPNAAQAATLMYKLLAGKIAVSSNVK